MSHDYFSITIFKETFGLDMIEEDYNLKVTSSISIDLFAKAVEEGAFIVKGNRVFVKEN
ncbi:hypothetical protein [Lacrimispora xylanisolvens]|uniref:hypothetical protein n=1 Tax=Lacrimispora xylanisolvens TaxID=384636 RepID=UPI002402843B